MEKIEFKIRLKIQAANYGAGRVTITNPPKYKDDEFQYFESSGYWSLGLFEYPIECKTSFKKMFGTLKLSHLDPGDPDDSQSHRSWYYGVGNLCDITIQSGIMELIREDFVLRYKEFQSHIKIRPGDNHPTIPSLGKGNWNKQFARYLFEKDGLPKDLFLMIVPGGYNDQGLVRKIDQVNLFASVPDVVFTDHIAQENAIVDRLMSWEEEKRLKKIALENEKKAQIEAIKKELLDTIKEVSATVGAITGKAPSSDVIFSALSEAYLRLNELYKSDLKIDVKVINEIHNTFTARLGGDN